MTRRIQIICAILCAAMMVFAINEAVLPKQQAYQGKSLDQWLEQFYDNSEDGPDLPENKQALVAINHIGTNGLPHLLDLIGQRDSWLKQVAANYAPDFFKLRAVSYKHMLGVYGFIALGENSKTAVPSLVVLADNPDPEIRYAAIVALGYLDCAPHQIVPVLIKHLGDTRVQSEAAEGLGRLHQEPEIAIPALVHNIGPDPGGWDNSYFAISGLADFGGQAKSAVPVILRRLQADYDENDKNPALREMITNAVMLIDPATAAQTGFN